MASVDRQRKRNELDLHNHCKTRLQSAIPRFSPSTVFKVGLICWALGLGMRVWPPWSGHKCSFKFTICNSVAKWEEHAFEKVLYYMHFSWFLLGGHFLLFCQPVTTWCNAIVMAPLAWKKSNLWSLAILFCTRKSKFFCEFVREWMIW